MQSYPPPDVPAYMTAAEAKRALNKMKADALADKEHPAFNSQHPQSKDFADYSTRLYTIIATAEAEAADALEAQALEAALEATDGMTPEQCLARARELTLTPGYVNGTMAPEERAKLATEISTLYRAGTHNPDPDEEQVEDEQ